MDIWDACTFWLLMNNVAMNTSVQVFVGTSVLTSLSYIPRSRTAGSYGNSMMNLLKNCQIVFQSGGIILYFHQSCMSPHFFTSKPTLIASLFDYSHPSGYEVVSHCGFYLHFSDA